MKKILILLLITLSFCRFLQFEETGETKPKEQPQITNFNAISVFQENVKRIEKFQGKDKLVSYIKKETKDLEELKKKWTEAHGQTFLDLSKMGINGDSSTLIFPGLLSARIEDILVKKGNAAFFNKELSEEYKNFLKTVKENKEGKLETFIKVYRDETVDKIFRLFIVVDYARDDDRHDVMFISSKRQFEIPPIIRLKESAKDKEEKDLTKDDFELYTPDDFSEEQLNTIYEWYGIAAKVALSAYAA